MKEIILACASGTRLYPITKAIHWYLNGNVLSERVQDGSYTRERLGVLVK